MGNCLVTKLKGSVNNDNLPYFGCATIICAKTGNLKPGCILLFSVATKCKFSTPVTIIDTSLSGTTYNNVTEMTIDANSRWIIFAEDTSVEQLVIVVEKYNIQMISGGTTVIDASVGANVTVRFGEYMESILRLNSLILDFTLDASVLNNIRYFEADFNGELLDAALMPNLFKFEGRSDIFYDFQNPRFSNANIKNCSDFDFNWDGTIAVNYFSIVNCTMDEDFNYANFGKLTSLLGFIMQGNTYQISKDKADIIANAMYANGRTSGTLTVEGVGTYTFTNEGWIFG